MQQAKALLILIVVMSVLITTSLCVAADGQHSATRQRLGIDVTEKSYGQTAIVSTIGLKRPHQRIAYERFSAEGPIALLPLPDQRVGLIWSAPDAVAAECLALSDDAFLARLQRQFGYRLGKFVRVGTRASYPLSTVSAKQLTTNRCVIIGNAAHALHPIAGQGFNLGLRDVAFLAETLRDCLATKQDIGDQAALAQYVKTRQHDQKNIEFLCDFLPRVFAHQYRAFSWFRDSCIVSIEALPTLKHYFMRHTMGLHGRLSTLACGMELSL